MDNQHKKIKGYRALSQTEIDLMNRIKDHAEVTKALMGELQELREDDNAALHNSPLNKINGLTLEDLQESQRCLHLSKVNLQTGFMWLVRAVALPQSF